MTDILTLDTFVKNDIIDKDIIAKLLNAKNDKIIIYAIVTSIFKDSWHLSSGFFSSWTVFDTKHILTPDYQVAKSKFDELFNELRTKLGPFQPRADTRTNKTIKSKYQYADFEMGFKPIPEISFLKKWNICDIIQYGTNIRLSLKKLELPLESICYEPLNRSLCYHHQDSYEIDYYSPITLNSIRNNLQNI